MYIERAAQGHGGRHEDSPEEVKQKPIFDEELAKTILDQRECLGAFGFHDLSQLFEIDRITRGHIENLLHRFGHMTYGHWDTLPYDTLHPDGRSVDVAHAALLHTGKVLFIPADYQSAGWRTPIWDPSNERTPLFEYPRRDPDYALFCGGHSFLSDGKLLVVGGGGDRYVTRSAFWGFKFDPRVQTWTRTAGQMQHGYRWYPTAVTLGDYRVLVTCGNGRGDPPVA